MSRPAAIGLFFFLLFISIVPQQAHAFSVTGSLGAFERWPDRVASELTDLFASARNQLRGALADHFTSQAQPAAVATSQDPALHPVQSSAHSSVTAPLQIGSTVTARPNASAAGSLILNVPLQVSRTLSVSGSATLGVLHAGGLSTLTAANFTGPVHFAGPITALGSITTQNGDITASHIFASNIVNTIHAGTGVAISGTPTDPILTVTGTGSNQPILFGGGGSLSKITAGSGLTGDTITTQGTIALDTGSANSWSALQTFSAGLTVTGALTATDASTTLLSVLGPAYFGSSATSTFGTDGTLTLAKALAVASGGTGVSNVGALFIGSSGTTVGANGLYGPCDIIAASGQTCVAAHSVTRRLFGSYTGPLFQLSRASDSSTQDVGSTASGVVNTATVATFCAGTSCYISKIYDQSGNGNVLPQTTQASQAPWLLYPTNGLPIVATPANAAFYRNRPGNGGATSNLPTGAASATTYYIRATDIYGSCCGEYGRMESSVNSISAGQMWALGYQNGTGTLGFGVDLEGTLPTTALPSTLAVAGYLSKFNQSTGLYTDKVWDASKGSVSTLVTKSPTQTPIVQAGLSLGEGGDGSTAPTEFFEGVVASGVTTDATDAAIAANVAAFYAPGPSVPLGPADITLSSSICAGALCANHTKRDLLAAIGGAWGFRKLRASYTGYAANIRRASDNATQNIGFTATGDFDDATAQAFCAGTTCFVVKLYNQALTPLSNNTGAGAYDMVQATAAKQPQVIFNDLNNRTAMRSNGSQYMCSAGPLTSLGPSWTMSVVAERTGNTSARQVALGSNGFQGTIGFAASSNTAETTAASNGAAQTASASDNTWHSLIGQINAKGTNGDLSLQVDNGVSATNTGNGNYAFDGTFNQLFSSSFGTNCSTSQNIMTGDIAEAMIFALGGSGSNWTGVLSPAQLTAIYDNQQAYYGTFTSTPGTATFFPGFGIWNSSGNVGIGTTSPSSLLSITGSNSTTTLATLGTPTLQIENADPTNNNFASLDFRGIDTTGVEFSGAKIAAVLTNHSNGSTAGDLSFLTRSAGALTEKMRLTGAGNLGIATSTPYSRLEVWGPDTASTSAFAVVNNASTTVFAVYDSGNSTYSGSIFQSSDQRLKTNISSLDASSSLMAIEALNPVSYLRLDQSSEGTSLGFLAQQVAGIFPELISTTSPTALTPDGTVTLNYTGLIAPIVSAIKEIATISGAFKDALVAWLGDASNGIHDLYATVIHAHQVTADELCAGTTCITQTQLDAILSQTGQAGPIGQGSAPAGVPSAASASTTPDTANAASSATSTATTTAATVDTAISSAPDATATDASSSPSQQ